MFVDFVVDFILFLMAHTDTLTGWGEGGLGRGAGADEFQLQLEAAAVSHEHEIDSLVNEVHMFCPAFFPFSNILISAATDTTINAEHDPGQTVRTEFPPGVNLNMMGARVCLEFPPHFHNGNSFRFCVCVCVEIRRHSRAPNDIHGHSRSRSGLQSTGPECRSICVHRCSS